MTSAERDTDSLSPGADADAADADAGAADRPARVRRYLRELQDRICGALEERENADDEGGRTFREDVFERGRGVSRPRVLEGEVIERSGVNFTHTAGARLPAAATERRPDLEGGEFEAVSISLIVHPKNPHAPTCHANWRYFEVTPPDGTEPAWWFGGGFDLTPYYGYEEDAAHWHRVAKNACDPFGHGLYSRFKQNCDEYFYLEHRDEPRGIGGLFFDDYAGEGEHEGDFEHVFALVRSMGDSFLPAYLPILDRRKDHPFTDNQRWFQRYRRGRYVEFNLIYDRGTRFGLQAGGRAESILVSMPPQVIWTYDYHPEPGSAEAGLYQDFLRPRDWIAVAEAPETKGETADD